MPRQRRGAAVVEHLGHGVQLQAARQLYLRLHDAAARRHHLHRHARGRDRRLPEGEAGLAQARRPHRLVDREARRPPFHPDLTWPSSLRAHPSQAGAAPLLALMSGMASPGVCQRAWLPPTAPSSPDCDQLGDWDVELRRGLLDYLSFAGRFHAIERLAPNPTSRRGHIPMRLAAIPERTAYTAQAIAVRRGSG